ncbi:cation:proton antiporter [Streptomyces boninensis]|uniref:cation:proton antiporter n=1 Tax=Streptomyces boninensis TaxID=2039455 RepID=UPI003B213A01
MPGADAMPAVLLAVPVVLLAAQAGGAAMRRIGQPPVVGEIAAGILLGPSLLGWLWPEGQEMLLPQSVVPHLGTLGELGLLCYMFLMGAGLDLQALRGHGRTAVLVSQTSIAVPMALGGLLALAMYPSLAPDGVDRLPFVLFIGVAMSITAFPVLARILTEKGLYRGPLGALAIAVAAVDDVMAWCLLAAVAAIGVGGTPLDAVTTAALTAAFAALLLGFVRPVLARSARWQARRDDTPAAEALVLVLLFSGLCLSALATDRIGVHAVFGAFVFGLVVPRESRIVQRCARRLRVVVVPVLLPLFFVKTGLATDIGLLADPVLLLWTAAVLAVAMLGKLGGGAVAARAAGRPWRTALSLGVLLNCRGLTELVVLNVGLSMGVIGEGVFTILVLMALATTAATGPALTWLRRVPADRPACPRADAAPEPAGPRHHPRTGRKLVRPNQPSHRSIRPPSVGGQAIPVPARPRSRLSRSKTSG